MTHQQFVRRFLSGTALGLSALALAACTSPQPTSPSSVTTPQRGDSSREQGFMASPMPTGQVGGTGVAGSPALSTDPAAPSTGARAFGTTTAGEIASATTPTIGLGNPTAQATPNVAGISVQQLTVPIVPLNNSGVTGTATLADLGNGRTSVSVMVTGSTDPHTARIETGTCTEGDSSPRWPLSDVRAGSSTTELDVPLTQLMASPMTIELQTAQDSMTPAACGDIQAG